jgi:hypothetical protein
MLLLTVYLYNNTMIIIFMLFRFLSVVCVKISHIASHVMRKGIFQVRHGILTTVQHAPVPKVPLPCYVMGLWVQVDVQTI